ncbi:MAG: FixH family protein, partial [Gammaproteobacteria bacterium]|nr:FixH family protein [Gammaproteobacteria bacterium]
VDRIEAELRLQRPGAVEAALVLPLAAVDAGTYGGVLHVPAGGRWLAELRLLRDREMRYQLIQELAAP